MRHIAIIQKHTGNVEFEKFAKEKFATEFDYLDALIDSDKFHFVRLMPENDFCRYADIRPYEDNYVQIESEHHFINASWIDMPYTNYFISTQGPLQTTIEDFFEMCKIYKAQLILMLTDIEEDGKEKCAKYWDVKGLKNYEIQKRTETVAIDVDVYLRKLKISSVKDKEYIGTNIDQIQFIGWKDHEGLTYEYFEKIIKIIKKVEEYKKDKSDVPIIVHCSAGVGRSGTFICMYNLYLEIMEQIANKEIKEIKFSIMNLVRKIKEMRMHSVENEKQYHALFLFVNYILYKYNV